MTVSELLKLTVKELDAYINTVIPNVSETSEYPEYVRTEMINEVQKLLPNVEVRHTKTYGNEAGFSLGPVSITFKVSVKGTGKLVSISKLRKREKKMAGKFKISEVVVSISRPCFEADDLSKSTIKIKTGWSVGDEYIDLVHRTERLEDMLTKEILMHELSNQNKDFTDIRKHIILEVAQPLIKSKAFGPDWNQAAWDKCLKDTAEVNKDLIDSVIDKMFSK